MKWVSALSLNKPLRSLIILIFCFRKIVWRDTSSTEDAKNEKDEKDEEDEEDEKNEAKNEKDVIA